MDAAPRLRRALGALGAIAVVTLCLLERRRPLRPSRYRLTTRWLRNGALAALGAVVVQAVETPLTLPAARWVERRRIGLTWLLPGPLRGLAGLLALDYTLYRWHVLNHRVPWLWRFHAVHHLDGDMDVSTAVRFHPGELLLSIPWRLGQIVLLGIDPQTLGRWQSLLLASILFHHANLRLDPRVERTLGRWIVTPALHGLHHARLAVDRDVNWSSGLTLWDHLHGTYRLPPSEPLPVGIERLAAGHVE